MVLYLLTIVWLLIRNLFRGKPRSIFEESVEPSRVWPQDIDYLLHMNNAVYSTKFEMGRTDFWLANHGYQTAKKLKNARTGKPGCYFVIGSLTVRFRKELRLWQRFNIHSKIVGWDDKAFYVEQQLVNSATTGRDKGFVHAVGVIKQVLVGSTPAELLAAMGVPKEKLVSPPIPERIQLLIQHDQRSSELLRGPNAEASTPSLAH